MKLKQFIQQETVLTAAAVLAVVSAFFVPPDAQYLGYIDLRTLAILFSLMTVMAGLRRQGFFDGLGRALLSRTHSTFQLTLVLVGLCFFGSMFITNDVSLLTFVPFTFVVLSRLGADVRRSLLIPVVCMQTIAANLGSMLTPIGNPQNLYLYGKSGMSIVGFFFLCCLHSECLLLLLAWQRWSAGVLTPFRGRACCFFCHLREIRRSSCCIWFCLPSAVRDPGTALACLCRCTRLRSLPDPRTPYGRGLFLLLTFVAFSSSIGNLGAHSAFPAGCREFLTKPGSSSWRFLLRRSPVMFRRACCCPGFTAETQALIIGTNLRSWPVASMASLISYRQIARELTEAAVFWAVRLST